jgi:predicted nucleic-acid-binding protein
VPTVDTNVLVRLLVSDDPKQARHAEALAKDAERTGEPLFVPLTVALELEWVLRSRYGFARAVVLKTLASLLETREIEFQDEASVERALFFYRTRNADFAECLHLGCAITSGRLPLVTFDRQAAKLAGAQLLLAE